MNKWSDCKTKYERISQHFFQSLQLMASPSMVNCSRLGSVLFKIWGISKTRKQKECEMYDTLEWMIHINTSYTPINQKKSHCSELLITWPRYPLLQHCTGMARSKTSKVNTSTTKIFSPSYPGSFLRGSRILGGRELCLFGVWTAFFFWVEGMSWFVAVDAVV